MPGGSTVRAVQTPKVHVSRIGMQNKISRADYMEGGGGLQDQQGRLYRGWSIRGWRGGLGGGVQVQHKLSAEICTSKYEQNY